MKVPQADFRKLLPDSERHEGRIGHLAIGRNDDVSLTTSLNGVLEDLFG
jgi:hypothetical protein